MGKQKLKDLVKQLNADNAPPNGWIQKTRSPQQELRTNLKPVKYMLLLEVPVLAASQTVIPGRRVR